jgi:hypothetical protein
MCLGVAQCRSRVSLCQPELRGPERGGDGRRRRDPRTADPYAAVPRARAARAAGDNNASRLRRRPVIPLRRSHQLTIDRVPPSPPNKSLRLAVRHFLSNSTSRSPRVFAFQRGQVVGRFNPAPGGAMRDVGSTCRSVSTESETPTCAPSYRVQRPNPAGCFHRDRCHPGRPTCAWCCARSAVAGRRTNASDHR